jgi:hypothetical protein
MKSSMYLSRSAVFLLVVAAAAAVTVGTCHAHVPLPRTRAPGFHATAVINEKFEKVDLDGFEDEWVVLLF